MEVSVNLAEPRGSGLQLPAPLDALELDLPENRRREQAVSGRVRIQDPHDALAVAHEIADPADVQARFLPANPMNLQKVVAQGVGPPEIQIVGDPGVADAGGIAGVA